MKDDWPDMFNGHKFGEPVLDCHKEHKVETIQCPKCYMEFWKVRGGKYHYERHVSQCDAKKRWGHE